MLNSHNLNIFSDKHQFHQTRSIHLFSTKLSERIVFHYKSKSSHIRLKSNSYSSSAFVPNHKPCSDKDIQQLQTFISKSKHLFVITGAGISTESGIPDYRSEGVGLYSTSTKRPIQIKVGQYRIPNDSTTPKLVLKFSFELHICTYITKVFSPLIGFCIQATHASKLLGSKLCRVATVLILQA